MPPFLSSLAAALLSSQRLPLKRTDIFSVSLDDFSPQPDSAPPPRLEQHPIVSLSVAYALFLVGRGNAHRTDAQEPPAPTSSHRRDRSTGSRRVSRLAVRLNLASDDGVEAEMLDGNPVVMVDHHSQQTPVQPSHCQIDLAHASDLRASKRDIAIVTTAAIPWMTGTSINPALRAIYLAKDNHRVTLVVPWLSTPAEQLRVFAKGSPTFRTPQQQKQYIYQWADTQVPGVHFDILFYDGVYADDFGSILPVGSITDVFTVENVINDVCILEEPEHLTWHHSGNVWTELFNIVIGIIHTNYIEYANNYGFFGPQKAFALFFLNMWVCRGYCHRIIKLSDAVQEFPNSVTSNVHGVARRFITIGKTLSGPFPRGAYFMGKVLWAKGYRDLIDNMVDYYNRTGERLPIDFFGAGPDSGEVRAEVESLSALSAVHFDDRVADPTGEVLRGYKVFVNCSRSDVVCTATAEALAMGKLVVCLEHPSNQFFAAFPNCITYRTPMDFGEAVKDALSREPKPLSESDSDRLTWEAATDRLYDAMRLPLSKSRRSKFSLALASAHATLSKIYPQPGKGIQKAMSKESLSGSPAEQEQQQHEG